MKKGLGLFTKVLSIVLAVAIAIGFCGKKAYAFEKFNYSNSVVFSIAKGIVTDKTNLFKFDGKNREDYFQIHDSAEAAAEDKKNKNDDYRYAISPVTRSAISVEIANILTDYTGETVKAQNQPNFNEQNSAVGAYKTEVRECFYSTGTELNERNLVEAVLYNLGILDQASTTTANYVQNIMTVEELKQINGITDEQVKVIKEGTYNVDWYIDWYVIKGQNNGVHVDGVMVIVNKTVDPEPEYDKWTVVYNFEQKDSEEPESIGLKDTISVEKESTPNFNREEIKKASEVDSKFDDDLYTLRKENEEAVVKYNSNEKTINIYYDLRDEWTVVYYFEQKEADPARFELPEKLIVDKGENPVTGENPVFGENDILLPAAVGEIVDEVLSNDDYVLFVNEHGAKFVLTGDKTIEIRYDLVKADPKEDPNKNDDPKQNDDPKEEPTTPVVPKNPTFVPDEPEKEVTVEETPKEEPKEELPVEEPATPEGTPEEEIPVDEIPGTPEGAPEEEEIPVDEVPGTPEGAPEEEEEEEIPVDLPATPEGDVLPQTGVAGAATFFGFGAAFIGLGAAVIRKGIRREEI